MGFFSGLWAVLLTTASEQFGTNIRATVTSTVPNFVRGCTVPLSFAFLSCKEALGIVTAVHIVGAISFFGAVIGLKMIRESFGISLSYVEVARGQSDHDAPAFNKSTTVEEELPRASGY